MGSHRTFVTILASPHMSDYDSGLILVPLAVAISVGVRTDRTEVLVGIYTMSSLLTIMSLGPFASINNRIAPGAVGMLVLCGLWLRIIADSNTPSALETTPVDRLTIDAFERA